MKQHIMNIREIGRNFCIALGIIFCICITNAFATAQYPDCLIQNDKRYALIENIMEPFFEKFPEKRPPVSSTALWRGYVATFEIIKNELWVVDVQVEAYDKIKEKRIWESIIKSCLDGKDKMKIDWFTGILVLPHGKMVEYVHMGYASKYEYHKLIKIENGNYLKELDISLEQYDKIADMQYEMYKKTDAYREDIKELDPDGKMSKEMLESFIKRVMFKVDLTKIFQD